MGSLEPSRLSSSVNIASQPILWHRSLTTVLFSIDSGAIGIEWNQHKKIKLEHTSLNVVKDERQNRELE
ncbi:hypothetical protein TSUD_45530 [Trifolium subterraneum]|nr:hypothetical protein TSUD_45530 [Trifolium subterraneum]